MFEVVSSTGERIALCNSRQLAESYAAGEAGSKILIKT